MDISRQGEEVRALYLREGVGREGEAADPALVARRGKGRAAHERVAEAVVEGAQARAADVQLARVLPALVARHLALRTCACVSNSTATPFPSDSAFRKQQCKERSLPMVVG